MYYNNIKVVNYYTENSSKIKAITHSGVFHTDEVFSTAILAGIILEKENFIVCRTNEIPETINVDGDNPIVYDIGDGKYDHHGVEKLRPNTDIPYSSAGLIWADYGKELIGIQLKNNGLKYDEELVDVIWKSIDNTLFTFIDAMDNGVNLSNEKNIRVFTVVDIISSYNPLWDDYVDENYCFVDAVWAALKILKKAIKRQISAYGAKTLIDTSIANSTDDVIVLPTYVPWQGNLFNSKEENAGNINWVIFPSKRGGWNIQTVPVIPGDFDNHRKDFPQEWWGHPEATGVPECKFIHKSGFLANCITIEACLELAKKA